MKRKRFTEDQIIGILKDSDQKRIQALESYGDPQTVPQRIASIVREMRPNPSCPKTQTRCQALDGCALHNNDR